MRKNFVLVLSLCILFVASCKKKDTTAGPDPGPASPYYFKFKFADTSRNLNANLPQYMSFYANVAGGYQVANINLAPSVGLSFTWPSNDTVRESDILNLKGKTIYFDDTVIHPGLTYDVDLPSQGWESIDTNNHSYFVQISDITFLKKDTTLGNPVRLYVITGTCNAVMSRGAATGIFSNGEFHFVITRRDL